MKVKSVLLAVLVSAVLVFLLSFAYADEKTSYRKPLQLVAADDALMSSEDPLLVIDLRSAVDTARGATPTTAQWNEISYNLTVELNDPDTTGIVYFRVMNKDTTPVEGDIDGSTTAVTGLMVQSGKTRTIVSGKERYLLIRSHYGSGYVSAVLETN